MSTPRRDDPGSGARAFWRIGALRLDGLSRVQMMLRVAWYVSIYALLLFAASLNVRDLSAGEWSTYASFSLTLGALGFFTWLLIQRVRSGLL